MKDWRRKQARGTRGNAGRKGTGSDQVSSPMPRISFMLESSHRKRLYFQYLPNS